MFYTDYLMKSIHQLRGRAISWWHYYFFSYILFPQVLVGEVCISFVPHGYFQTISSFFPFKNLHTLLHLPPLPFIAVLYYLKFQAAKEKIK